MKGPTVGRADRGAVKLPIAVILAACGVWFFQWARGGQTLLGRCLTNPDHSAFRYVDGDYSAKYCGFTNDALAQAYQALRTDLQNAWELNSELLLSTGEGTLRMVDTGTQLDLPYQPFARVEIQEVSPGMTMVREVHVPRDDSRLAWLWILRDEVLWLRCRIDAQSSPRQNDSSASYIQTKDRGNPL